MSDVSSEVASSDSDASDASSLTPGCFGTDGRGKTPSHKNMFSGWLQHRNHTTYQRWADQHPGRTPNVESVSFMVATSVQTRMANLTPFSHMSIRVLFVLCCIGVTTGMVALFVDKGIDFVEDWRLGLNDSVAEAVKQRPLGTILQYLQFVGTSLACATVAGVLVCFRSPLAAGSGIPEIKCYLNGILLSRVVSAATLVAKAVGIIFSVGAGLPVGKEGPMIHSGSVIGGLFTRFIMRVRAQLKYPHPLGFAGEHRDLVAAGATAGVAAAFGAPIGACLFAIEEGTSHMNPSILMKLFASAAWAAAVSRWVLSITEKDTAEQPTPAPGHCDPWHPCQNHPDYKIWMGRMGTAVPVFLERFGTIEYFIWEMPIFMSIGFAGGLIGGLFCFANKHITRWRQYYLPGPQYDANGDLIIQRRDVLRFCEVLFVTFVVSSVNFWIPMSQHWAPCALDELTGVEKLFWKGGTAALRSLLHATHHFDTAMLWVFFLSHMVFTCWTYGLGVPSGLFVPSLVGGAAMGRLVGQAMNYWVPFACAAPGIYALIGATAVLSGCARITISLAMILMEVTGDCTFSLPIFATVMTARWCGNKFGRGIYDMHIIEMKRVPLLEHTPEAEMLHASASAFMARDVVSIEEFEPAWRLHEKLSSCKHNGFPVVRDGRPVGLIGRDFLHYLLNNGQSLGLFSEEHQVVPLDTMMHHLLRGLPKLEPLTEEFKQESVVLDVRPYMTKDYFSMSEEATTYSCYQLFRQLGLRHLMLVNCQGKLTGIMTRKDLILVEEDQAERNPRKGSEEVEPSEQGSSPGIRRVI